MNQKKVFLESEGDAWFRRNTEALAAAKLPDSDPLLMEILRLLPDVGTGLRILEIGCGEAVRLGWLRKHRDLECYGVDPSAKAVAAARRRGVEAHQGTADHLPFQDGDFDIVSFGFCLSWCDPEDLFRIAYESDRVLANPGWLLILDFYSPTPTTCEYHHRPGLFTRKMDYRTLFAWNPGYTCLAHRVLAHSECTYTDDPSQWVATSVLRKHIGRSE